MIIPFGVDCNPQGGYVIVTINDSCRITNKNSIAVEFIFDYNIEKAAEAIEESPCLMNMLKR